MYDGIVLDVRSLSKAFEPQRRSADRVTALDSVDLHVAEGEFVTVLGPSGCGKTTLLRSIAGFEQGDSGTISVDGRIVDGPGTRTVPAHERGVGIVPQEGALFPHLSVSRNVGFGLTGMGRRERKRRIAETLELVGLSGFESRHPHELSGGQQQRVAVARAIAPGPRVVLFDEPFSALDEYLRESLRSDVRHLLRKIGATAVLVTHDQEEAMALGDSVVVMREGRVVQSGNPRDTYYRPADLELARFLGDAVILDGEVTDTPDEVPTVSCALGRLPVGAWHGACGRCDVLIRPENISICPLAAAQQNRAATAQQNRASAAQTREGGPLDGAVGTVLSQTFYGHDGVIRVKVPELAQDVSVRVMGDRPFDVGDPVRLTVDSPVCTYAA